MRLIGSLILAVVVAVLFHSCFEAPHYPATPAISFNSVIFRKGPAPTQDHPSPADSLIATINFKDGDGDLGLGAQDSGNLQYANRFYYVFNDGTYITYKTKRTDARFDTLPPFVSPYTCTNWEIIYDDTQQIPVPVDTLYFQLNPNYYNIFVDIYVLQPDGTTFKKFDWLNEFPDNCLVGGLNGRFPILSNDLSQSTAQEGTIRYSIPSAGYQVIFSVKTLYLEIYIQDRAFHKSNVVTTPTFTLQSILK